MIHAFQPIDHPLHLVHGLVIHMVSEVWLTSPIWSLDLVKPELKELILAIDAGKKPGNELEPRLRVIHEMLKELPDEYRSCFRDACDLNNDVQGLCGSCGQLPLRYKDVKLIWEQLAQYLKELFKDLYSDILNAAPVATKYGTMKEHYGLFMAAQGTDMCPFCGLLKLQTEDHSKRDAYDHYLPKGLYPFNSINFKQLVPMCPRCNSQYKLAKDPLYDGNGVRRKAFYPFNCPSCSFSIAIDLPAKAIADIDAADVTFALVSTTHKDEVETWKDLFGLEERYRAECSSSTGGKHWAKEVLNYAARMPKVTVDDVYQAALENAKDAPRVAQNFLRAPFLEACQRIGVFN